MNSTAASAFSEPADVVAESDDFRTMSSGAVAGLFLGVISAIMLGAVSSGVAACLVLAPVPILGMVVSGRSLARIRRFPDDYTGGGLATAGLFLSGFFLVMGLGSGIYVSATEVPEGYEPISFLGMKPDELDERGDVLIPEKIRRLDGQRVFIKGYMRPQEFKSNLSAFLLVRDNQECCFGPLSDVKYYDQMRVELVSPLVADYSTGMFRVGGRLKIHPENLAYGSSQPVFTLVADYLQ